jgi:hypothetical protein
VPVPLSSMLMSVDSAVVVPCAELATTGPVTLPLWM